MQNSQGGNLACHCYQQIAHGLNQCPCSCHQSNETRTQIRAETPYSLINLYEKELLFWKQSFESCGDELLDARKTIDTQQAKIDALGKALSLFGAHLALCDYPLYAPDRHISCICGFDDALKLARG